MREFGADRPWDGWVTVDPLDDGSGRVRITVWRYMPGRMRVCVSKSALLDPVTAKDLAVEIAYTSEGDDHDDGGSEVGVDRAEGQGKG